MSDDHGLVLGGFDFIRGEGNGWWAETIADGMSFGEAEAVEVIQRTLLQDGDAVSIDRYGNRVVTFQVKIRAADSLALAEGGAALDAEIGKRNTLTWQPPDGWGPASVYDVFSSTISFDFDDWGEMKPLTFGRVFTVTLTCHPFPRSDEETVVEAIASGEGPPAASTATVDDCTSAAGWSLSANPSTSSSSTTAFGPTVTSGAVRGGYTWTAPSATVASAQAKLTRTGLTSDMTTTNLLKVQVSSESPAAAAFSFEINGDPVDPIAQADGVYWFDCSALTTLTSFAAQVESSILKSQVASPWTLALRVLDITRTNVLPFVSTSRQQFRSVTVGGSARTEGSLQLAHEEDALGEVLVYTNAEDGSGYQPPCRRHRTAGGAVTTDTATMSGAYEPLNSGTPFTVDIPAASVPAGTYSILGRVRASGSLTALLTVAASTLVGSHELGQRVESRFLSLTTAWAIGEIGRITLPPVAVRPTTSTFVRIEVETTSAVDLDELWIFNTDIGALTWVSCGTGTPEAGGASNRLWVDTATLDWPRPALWLGTAADRSDSRHALGSEVKSLGTHTFPPGIVNVFSVSAAEDVAASLTFSKRWANNAA